MERDRDIHVLVYQLFDEILHSQGIPPGAGGRIHLAIDRLRTASSAQEMISLAETLSLRIHEFEWARRTQNETSEIEARQAIERLAAAWLEMRVLH